MRHLRRIAERNKQHVVAEEDPLSRGTYLLLQPAKVGIAAEALDRDHLGDILRTYLA